MTLMQCFRFPSPESDRTAGANRGFLPPSAFMDVVPEQRQGPSQLRVARNSPRAIRCSVYHHSDDRPVSHHENKLRYSAPVSEEIPGFTGADRGFLPPSAGFPELLLDSNVICPINAYLCNLITSNRW